MTVIAFWSLEYLKLHGGYKVVQPRGWNYFVQYENGLYTWSLDCGGVAVTATPLHIFGPNWESGDDELYKRILNGDLPPEWSLLREQLNESLNITNKGRWEKINKE